MREKTRFLLYALLLVVVPSVPFRVSAATESVELPAPSQTEETPPADVAGWRVCPACGELNKPEASFCIHCGGDLGAGRSQDTPYFRPGIALEPNLSFFYTFTQLGPGFSFVADGNRVREEATVFAVFDFDYGSEYESTFIASDTQIYLTKHALKPYVNVNVKIWVAGDAVVELGPGAGVRYDYDRRGSFFYCGAGFNARAFPMWNEHSPDDYQWDGVFSAKTHLTQYYAKHAGVTFAAQMFSGGAIITVGHAFLF